MIGVFLADQQWIDKPTFIYNLQWYLDISVLQKISKTLYKTPDNVVSMCGSSAVYNVNSVAAAAPGVTCNAVSRDPLQGQRDCHTSHASQPHPLPSPTSLSPIKTKQRHDNIRLGQAQILLIVVASRIPKLSCCLCSVCRYFTVFSHPCHCGIEIEMSIYFIFSSAVWTVWTMSLIKRRDQG